MRGDPNLPIDNTSYENISGGWTSPRQGLEKNRVLEPADQLDARVFENQLLPRDQYRLARHLIHCAKGREKHDQYTLSKAEANLIYDGRVKLIWSDNTPEEQKELDLHTKAAPDRVHALPIGVIQIKELSHEFADKTFEPANARHHPAEQFPIYPADLDRNFRTGPRISAILPPCVDQAFDVHFSLLGGQFKLPTERRLSNDPLADANYHCHRSIESAIDRIRQQRQTVAEYLDLAITRSQYKTIRTIVLLHHYGSQYSADILCEQAKTDSFRIWVGRKQSIAWVHRSEATHFEPNTRFATRTFQPGYPGLNIPQRLAQALDWTETTERPISGLQYISTGVVYLLPVELPHEPTRRQLNSQRHRYGVLDADETHDRIYERQLVTMTRSERQAAEAAATVRQAADHDGIIIDDDDDDRETSPDQASSPRFKTEVPDDSSEGEDHYTRIQKASQPLNTDLWRRAAPSKPSDVDWIDDVPFAPEHMSRHACDRGDPQVRKWSTVEKIADLESWVGSEDNDQINKRLAKSTGFMVEDVDVFRSGGFALTENGCILLVRAFDPAQRKLQAWHANLINKTGRTAADYPYASLFQEWIGRNVVLAKSNKSCAHFTKPMAADLRKKKYLINGISWPPMELCSRTGDVWAKYRHTAEHDYPAAKFVRNLAWETDTKKEDFPFAQLVQVKKLLQMQDSSKHYASEMRHWSQQVNKMGLEFFSRHRDKVVIHPRDIDDALDPVLAEMNDEPATNDEPAGNADDDHASNQDKEPNNKGSEQAAIAAPRRKDWLTSSSPAPSSIKPGRKGMALPLGPITPSRSDGAQSLSLSGTKGSKGTGALAALLERNKSQGLIRPATDEPDGQPPQKKTTADKLQVQHREHEVLAALGSQVDLRQKPIPWTAEEATTLDTAMSDLRRADPCPTPGGVWGDTAQPPPPRPAAQPVVFAARGQLTIGDRIAGCTAMETFLGMVILDDCRININGQPTEDYAETASAQTAKATATDGEATKGYLGRSGARPYHTVTLLCHMANLAHAAELVELTFTWPDFKGLCGQFLRQLRDLNFRAFQELRGKPPATFHAPYARPSDHARRAAQSELAALDTADEALNSAQAGLHRHLTARVAWHSDQQRLGDLYAMQSNINAQIRSTRERLQTAAIRAYDSGHMVLKDQYFPAVYQWAEPRHHIICQLANSLAGTTLTAAKFQQLLEGFTGAGYLMASLVNEIWAAAETAIESPLSGNHISATFSRLCKYEQQRVNKHRHDDQGQRLVHLHDYEVARDMPCSLRELERRYEDRQPLIELAATMPPVALPELTGATAAYRHIAGEIDGALADRMVSELAKASGIEITKPYKGHPDRATMIDDMAIRTTCNTLAWHFRDDLSTLRTWAQGDDGLMRRIAQLMKQHDLIPEPTQNPEPTTPLPQAPATPVADSAARKFSRTLLKTLRSSKVQVDDMSAFDAASEDRDAARALATIENEQSTSTAVHAANDALDRWMRANDI